MFTGIIECIGNIKKIEKEEGNMHFFVETSITNELKIDQSVANTSMHLRKMFNEGLVSVENVGQKRLYTLKISVLEFWETYQDFIQELIPSLKINFTDFYGDINWNKDWNETLKLITKNEIILLDVRPSDEVTQEMLDDIEVIHIAQDELKKNLGKLSKKKKILVFCRGRMCALSAYSVNYLRENGFKAYRLDESWIRLKKEIESK